MKCGRIEVFEWLYNDEASRVTRVLSFVLLLLCSRQACSLEFTNSSITFLERCQADCNVQGDFVSCGKYRVVRWLHDAVREKEFKYGPFRIIRIPSVTHGSVLPKLPRGRFFKTSAMETLNFVRDAVEDLLTKRAIAYTIEYPVGSRGYLTGPMIVDETELEDLENKQEDSDGEWRIFKKKKSLILPLLILLNLIKLKLLLIPVLLSVHFIKKLLILGGFALSSILAHLKACKASQHHQQQHQYHTWATAADSPDYPTGYGHDDSGWSHRNDIQGYPGYPVIYGYRNPYG